ncbi:MAG TPA: nitroreductase family protein, partial [Candidatus Bathyarchaeia archaeon]|nr:nitroreductase family protein [Candidatus Bathyarchaeia archaeon]
MTEKRAAVEHPILDLLVERWSPYAFADRPLSEADLWSLFEAVRWAPSSYNEQPWSYIVARRQDAQEYERLLGC